ncbi:MAG: 3-dehydroquinate synthase [Prevotella sp.]|nr:3-dehydroquinate synthase [Bacteroides sp.]MCM1366056.1 3-dehydroquinate synthase [Prevotella sp.]MCM1436874.1 3-dehydroquinate synthase [Prevotella sp.]
MTNNVLFTTDTPSALSQYISTHNVAPILYLTDSNVMKCCAALFPDSSPEKIVAIEPGEESKNINTVTAVWNRLDSAGAARSNALINIGGGMVTDLGGFAASTFKRGIKFINVATSLLAAVDASTGGKTGINFNGVKNLIGAFAWPEITVIALDALVTLPTIEWLSGYGEMLKCGFIGSADMLNTLIRPDILENIVESESAQQRMRAAKSLSPWIKECVRIKVTTVEADPKESGLRKTLNFGHTIGHAFESFSIKSHAPGSEIVPHGIAVAYGILTELILSHLKLNLDSSVIERYSTLLRNYFPKFYFNCEDYDYLIDKMKKDKKNPDSAHIVFTLLSKVGAPHIDCTASIEEIRNALDITRDYLKI